MKKETLKEKIARLENEIAQLKNELEKKTQQLNVAWSEKEKLYDTLFQRNDQLDTQFIESPLYKQMNEENTRLKAEINLYKKRVQQNFEIRDWQVIRILELEQENTMLKEQIGTPTNK